MASATPGQETVTAAVLVIGDEILSGRTKDKKSATSPTISRRSASIFARFASSPTSRTEIVAAVNALRARYTMSSPPAASARPTTTSPPTPSPRRSASRSTSIRAPWPCSPSATAKADLNEARLRMARIPAGAELIENSVSKAPGFSLGNVHVMAGRARDHAGDARCAGAALKTGGKMLSRSVPAGMGEGKIAKALADVQGVPGRADRQLPDLRGGDRLHHDAGRCARATRPASTRPKTPRSRRC